MESQRHVTDKLDHACQTSFPECKTRLAIEKHASSVYTHKVFHASSVYTHKVFAEVSTEIEASVYDCTITEIIDDATRCSYKIKDKTDSIFAVIKYKTETLIKCSCKKLEQTGLLCCHAFVVLKDYPEIPREFLARRWMKSASITPHTKTGQIYQFAGGDEAAVTLNNLWSDFHSCIGLAQGNIDKLSNLSRLVSEEKVKLLKDQPQAPSMGGKQSVMETYCGSTSHLDISVLPPKQAKNKGSGSNVRSRILSQREKAIKASTKLKRKCGTCGEIGTHNSRTCPKRNTTP
ncbi:hypothetical protein DH2020_029205 [Rehmannia glutinosa]|uniref:SWIM-type domain-containing protein n=1 Tax=Rehmannia glutinosa TaxID=99300 RepID=A0ABR0VPA0_REHGL